jgi:flagellar hook assembly protein FlgD
VTLQNSSTAGIRVTAASPTITNCSFIGNASGLTNTSASILVNAALNYWNDASGPSGSGPGTGQSVSTYVNFEPWLRASPTTPEYLASAQMIDKVFNPTIGINFVLSFTSSLSGSWQFDVLNSGSSVVRTITGSGSSANVAWNGRDNSSTLLSDGIYSFRTQTTDSNNNTSASATGFMTLDSTKQLAITSISLTPVFFSPNNDGIQENSALSASFNFDQPSWTLNIRNSSNTIVRTETGGGYAMAFSWDGTDHVGGTVQPEGLYTFELIVTDGTAQVSDNTKSTTLDITLPNALISTPADSATLSNVYQSESTDVLVTGTANDDLNVNFNNFNNWDLYRGSGANPSSWTSITSGTTAVQSGTFASWATGSLANGIYTLRLRVWDKAGNLTTRTRTITIGNFSISQNVKQANAASGQTVTYTSIVPFDLNEIIDIKNEQGLTVRNLVVNLPRTANTYPDQWDGKNNAGNIVPDGGYFYTATVSVPGYTMDWNLSDQYVDAYTISDHPSLSAFDLFAGVPLQYSYDTTQPSQVSIIHAPSTSIAPNCAAPQYCSVISRYEPSGSHSGSWAGVDSTGAFRPDLDCMGAYATQETFSKNAVVIYGTRPTLTNLSITPLLFTPINGSQTVEFDVGAYQSLACDITVAFINQSSVSALRTITLSQHAVGHVSVSWDGRAGNGDLVAPGFYTVTVTVTDHLGSTVDSQVISTIEY